MTNLKEHIHHDSLSNTSHGKSWLSQFQESERETASQLLDSILYVSNSQLITGLHNLIIDFKKRRASGPIALFVARENTGETYWRKDSRPISVAGRLPVGSEGMLSNLCRDIARSNTNILDHPSVQEMRDMHCRHILCIDDMIGSGTRIVSFAEWLYMNKTIKSWHSLHYIDFVACVYAATEAGQQYISQTNQYSSVQFSQSLGMGRSTWTRNQREQIEDICRNYAQYTNKPYWPLGFQDAFTCIVFAHKCPNTNPAIIWASKKNSWNAVFADRPEFIVEAVIWHQKRYQQEKILKALGHTRITKPSFFSKLSYESRQLLILLSCLAAHRHRENILGDILELPLPIIRQQLERCLMYGWIDTGKRLTYLGKKVLIAARRNKYIAVKNIKVKNVFYYPQTFRSPARASSSGLRTGECREC